MSRMCQISDNGAEGKTTMETRTQQPRTYATLTTWSPQFAARLQAGAPKLFEWLARQQRILRQGRPQ